ncbi:hypothetical protein FRC15_004177 [Serendipita sp. 397]|nr:hypothetical protein FRC15_004177 [Serendipita sp. 397]
MSHQDTYNEYSNGAQPAAPSSQDGARGRSRSRSPARNGGSGSYRSPAPRSPNGGGGGGGSGSYRRRSPGPRKPNHAPSVSVNPTPSNVLGVFGLSIRTQERDLQDEFNRFGRVEKVTIVYDQRTDRSRGFGFIVMSSVDEATRCIQELNGVEMNGRRIRVDFSVTERPHAPTPGEYMGLRRSDYGDSQTEIGTDTTMIVATIGIGTATTATIVTLKTGGTSALLVEVAIHLVAEVALVPLAVQARPALKKDHADGSQLYGISAFKFKLCNNRFPLIIKTSKQ